MAQDVQHSLERWESAMDVDSWHSSNRGHPEESLEALCDELQRLRIEVRRVKDEACESMSRLQETEHHLKEALYKNSKLETLLKQRESTITELLTLRDTLESHIRLLLSAGNELSGSTEITRREVHASPVLQSFAEFPHTELVEATRNFDPNLKIGEGGFGSVYKGKLHYTTVAIKRLNPQNTQKVVEFQQEVNILSRIRHPNLVTLIGSCSESGCLVYEFLPNGSLEDRLLCKNGTEPLSWQIRLRIAAEVCCALLFLHSARPEAIVHGDLKPDNVLLDGNLTAKISDFGICRLLPRQDPSLNQTICRLTDPKGTTFYIDPQFSATNELTDKSDVYAFGVILLQLLTGKPAGGLKKKVEIAVSKRNLKAVLDENAGKWPLDEASELADLGLRCCELFRKSRPDLGSIVWKVVQRYI